MSWFQPGLVMDLNTLVAANAVRAMLLDSTYEFDPADSLADLNVVESAGGAYARIVMPGLTVDTSTPGIVRLMSASTASFSRPTSTPGWFVMYRFSDSAPILAVAFLDPTLDPIEVGFDDDVIGVRRIDPLP